MTFPSAEPPRQPGRPPQHRRTETGRWFQTRPPHVPATRTNWWKLIGLVLGVLVAIGGLAYLGFALFLILGFNSYGSNK